MHFLVVRTQKTAAEKIFSEKSGMDAHSGEYVWAVPDLVYMHDVLGPSSIKALREISGGKTRYKGRVIVVNDHIFPPKDIESSNNIKNMNETSESEGWETIPFGEGIEHTLLIENGIIKPGMLVVGTDSHTVTAGAAGAMGVGLGSTDIGSLLAMGKQWFKVPETILLNVYGRKGKYITGKDLILMVLKDIGVNGANYASMEFHLQKDTSFNMDDDLSIANMTVEAGAKTCIVKNSSILESNEFPESDAGSEYTERQYDISELEPQISMPYSPGNVTDARELEGTEVNQVYIGNCSNGTISDLREAASVLKGRRVKKDVKMIIIPATRKIFKQAISEGLIDIFIDSGATVGPSTCGACAGLHMGVLAENEVCITNINRNFRGRMGHPTSKVYLANSYVSAESAVKGYIHVPGE